MAPSICTADQRLNLAADGYVTDLAYTRHHHATLDPARAALVAQRAGLPAPLLRRACELGFGQGLSLAIHATASDTLWWGVDIQSTHVDFARSLIADPAARERIQCASFREFVARDDLPSFDFIAMHGVWSWISRENRELLLAFIDQKLAPGGIVYLGYNALPGWGPALSLRELLVARASSASLSSLPLEQRIEAALEFAVHLVATDPKVLASQPRLEQHLRNIRSQKKSYLAHEYFNHDWHPMPFAQVAADLSPLGLQYLGQADFSDAYDEWRLTEPQRDLLSTIDDVLLRETARDLMLDRRFRRDYWVRSEMRVNSLSYAKLDVSLQVRRRPVSAELNLPSEVAAWLASLGDESEPVARQIATEREHAMLGFALGHGLVDLAREATVAERFAQPVAELNSRILDRVFTDPEMSVLASPVTGSGVELGWWQIALIAAMREEPRAEACERVIERVMLAAQSLGIVLARSGFELTDAEARDELRLRYRQLMTQRADLGVSVLVGDN